MAKKQKPKKASSGSNPTGSTDSSGSSKAIAPKSTDLAALSPSSSKTIDLPGSSPSPANTATVDLQISSETEVNSEPMDLVKPNSDTAAASQIVSAQVASPEIDVDLVNAQPAPLSSGIIPADSGLKQPANTTDAAQFWKGYIKPRTRSLEPEGTPFTLESGEACVTIPNSVIEKNKKAWDSFILGQFYEEPPARGAVHAIVNGIWSKQRRDISVSKMEGHAFLLRVPCPHARRHILSQCLWQIDGQTMFVAKWAPGMNQEKPELSSVPVWLDFLDVPLQFFNEDALKEIAGLVGKPLYIHPSTLNLSNLEVAKVYTIIDPRKPLPEAVNARFESGDVRRIRVTSPWLPSVCGHCLKVGHTISRCSLAPKTCITCRSAKHRTEDCPRSNIAAQNGAQTSAQNGAPKGAQNRAQKSTLKDAPTVPIDPIPKANANGKAIAIVATLAPAVDSVVLAPDHVLEPPSSSKQKLQQQVFTTLKTNRFEASSSGQRTPPVPKLIGPSQGFYKSSSAGLNGLTGLKTGSLCVDLNNVFLGSPTGSPHLSDYGSSSGSELPSDEDDNPNDEGDKFINVVSRRIQKQLKSKGKAKARARGPQNL